MATCSLLLRQLLHPKLIQPLCKPSSIVIIISAGAKKLTSAKGVQAMAAAGTMVRQHLTVETDPERLVNFVCGLSVDRDTPDPALRPDSEYPDWLWTLRTERGAKRLDELEPDTYAYWRHIRRASMKRDAALRKTQIRFKDFRKIKPVD